MPSIGAISVLSMKVPLSTTRVSSPRLRKPSWARSVMKLIIRCSPGFIGVSKAKIR